MSHIRGLAPAVFLLPALMLIGCKQGNPNAPANVAGKVTYNGTPLSGGTVGFHSPKGNVSCPISADGTYNTVSVPDGEVTVTVETESVNPGIKQGEYKSLGGPAAAMMGKKGGGATKEGKMPGSSTPPDAPTGGGYVKIPGKYADPTKSGLKTTLKSGNNKYNIELTD
jgi:hypothetical protein